jgi:hypothetical protein
VRCAMEVQMAERNSGPCEGVQSTSRHCGYWRPRAGCSRSPRTPVSLRQLPRAKAQQSRAARSVSKWDGFRSPRGSAA